MTVEKQREVIRLWNQLRKVEGPAAEELRIQILECFPRRTRRSGRRERGADFRSSASAISV